MTLSEYQLRPVKTHDGKPWVQNCFVCNKPVNFLKLESFNWVRVGALVRHKKCYPGMPS